MGLMSTRRGRVSLGLLALSGGASLLMHARPLARTERERQAVEAAVVFWVILCLKTIVSTLWPEPAEARVAAVAAPAARAAAAPRRRVRRD